MEKSSAKNSVLAVDDEPMNLHSLRIILSDDYDVYTAAGGVQALEMVSNNPPDLILLDVMMPEMDGFEVLSALKNDEKTRSIPVIFITGLDSKEDEKKGLAMEAADYISKPFSADIVKLRVRNQIQIVNQIRTIENLSLIDQLTGIPNRRNLDNRFTMEWARAYREKLPISLMMMDIDKFKTFNDTYGHLIGDDVLKLVASTFELSLHRKSDFAARFGGEEFCIILPNTTIEGALDVAENIRCEVERLVIPCGEGKTTTVTVSIGVHSFVPSEDNSIPKMIEKADQALYTAKETGRNRVCAYGITASNAPPAKAPPSKAPSTAATPVETVAAGANPPYNAIQEKLSKIDGINIQLGLSHFSNSIDLYIETVKFFLLRLPAVISDMDNALGNDDYKHFSISVHSAKSMLSTVGASAMSRMAAKLEAAGKDGDKEYCKKNFPDLHDKLKELYEKLSGVFPESCAGEIAAAPLDDDIRPIPAVRKKSFM